MTSQIKKLISNLKKEIERLKEKAKKEEREKYDSFWDRFENWKVRLVEKQAQLQFAEKLIKAIKKDIEKIKIFDIYVGVYEEYKRLDQHVVMRMFDEFNEKLNKILDEEM